MALVIVVAIANKPSFSQASCIGAGSGIGWPRPQVTYAGGGDSEVDTSLSP